MDFNEQWKSFKILSNGDCQSWESTNIDGQHIAASTQHVLILHHVWKIPRIYRGSTTIHSWWKTGMFEHIFVLSFMNITCCSSLLVALSQQKKVRCIRRVKYYHVLISNRISSNLQGSCSRFRSDGFHWLLCQAHSHSNVCILSNGNVLRFDHWLLRNNILVYVFPAYLGEILPITTTVEAHDYLTLRPHNQFFSLFYSFDLIYNSCHLLGEIHTRGLYQNCWKFDCLIPPTAVLKSFESFRSSSSIDCKHYTQWRDNYRIWQCERLFVGTVQTATFPQDHRNSLSKRHTSFAC